MRWKELLKLPQEVLREPFESWMLQSRYMRDDGEGENGRTFWNVCVSHGHRKPNERRPTGFGELQWEICGRANRNELQKPARYECNKCLEKVPSAVLRKKIKRLQELHGTDPLNDRRGAVLATRKKHNL